MNDVIECLPFLNTTGLLDSFDGSFPLFFRNSFLTLTKPGGRFSTFFNLSKLHLSAISSNKSSVIDTPRNSASFLISFTGS